MKKSIFFHLLSIFFIFFFVTTTNSFTVPHLSSFPKTTKYQNPKTLKSNEDLHTYFYEQTLDHFNYLPESYKTFKQRYFVNFKYWGGANSSAPILAYLGGESVIDYSPSFMTDNAASLKALLVYIEHRYYGKSVPFKSREAFKNTSTLGYFNSAQALQDYADVLIHLKDSLHAQKSPVIVIGGSYAGMLATWFRLKYPHVTIGALASSAPLLYFDNITPENAYYDVITQDFKDTSETCYKFILNSWSEIDRVASQPNGLSILSQKFKTCHPLEHSDELKESLRVMYNMAAQYNYPPVTTICEGIDGAAFGSDILSRIYGGFVAGYGNNTCKVNPDKYTDSDTDAETFYGWGWQICTEMVAPISIGNSSMFQPKPFNFKSYAERCKKDYGVSPRPHFITSCYGGQICTEMVAPISIGNSSMFQPKPFNFKSYAERCKKDYGVSPRPHFITSCYGGQNIKLVLKKFASNIIFSNGLKDPWSSGGVLYDLSDSLVALPTVNGTHAQDLNLANESDPGWLVDQRKQEVEIIQRWISQYYADMA